MTVYVSWTEGGTSCMLFLRKLVRTISMTNGLNCVRKLKEKFISPIQITSMV
ncbi:hypothetical protein HOLleu_36059 [Holothuria leucospilota]|uniref:Uncharacterized protein n=1 Tax=Holothuria leucospilota TaxID=206669 RepID=A0A9Q0YQT5_HOLLE|nr:hypothetical protein HOLleu_36059 [Holothuria leucospilota]